MKMYARYIRHLEKNENHFIQRGKSERSFVSAIVTESRPPSLTMMERLIAPVLPATRAYRYS